MGGSLTLCACAPLRRATLGAFFLCTRPHRNKHHQPHSQDNTHTHTHTHTRAHTHTHTQLPTFAPLLRATIGASFLCTRSQSQENTKMTSVRKSLDTNAICIVPVHMLKKSRNLNSKKYLLRTPIAFYYCPGTCIWLS